MIFRVDKLLMQLPVPKNPSAEAAAADPGLVQEAAKRIFGTSV